MVLDSVFVVVRDVGEMLMMVMDDGVFGGVLFGVGENVDGIMINFVKIGVVRDKVFKLRLEVVL